MPEHFTIVWDDRKGGSCSWLFNTQVNQNEELTSSGQTWCDGHFIELYSHTWKKKNSIGRGKTSQYSKLQAIYMNKHPLIWSPQKTCFMIE